MDLSISTLRYYDKEGLLDNVERTPGGVRIFRDADIRQLHMIECLKSSGLPLKDIHTFFQWCKEGDSTIEQRYQMFLDRKAIIEQQMADLQNTLDMINYKCEYYRVAKEAGTLNTPRINEIKIVAANSSDYIKEIVGED